MDVCFGPATTAWRRETPSFRGGGGDSHRCACSVEFGLWRVRGGALAVKATSFHDGLFEELQLNARVTDAAICTATGTATYSHTVFGSYEGTVVGMTFFGSRARAVIRIDVGTGVFANPSFPFAIVHITDGGPPHGEDTMSGNTILDRFIPHCFEIGPATFFPLSSGNIIIR